MQRGVIASLAASVLFGVLFFLPSLTAPLDGNSIFAGRIFITLPLVVAALLLGGRGTELRQMLQRVHRRPILALVLTCNGLLLGVQLWIFAWAPVSGHGLDVALGYLLLPLIMVVVGRVIHREHLPRLRVAAVTAAAIGVISAIVLAGGISPATVVVALGYPIYFELRARFQVNTPGALALELATLVPVAIVLASLQPWPTTGTTQLVIGLLTIGLVSAAALLLYLRASELLPFGLFGLLASRTPPHGASRLRPPG